MDLRDKVKEMKKELESLSIEERMIRSSIEELKMLIKQKKAKEEAIKALKEEEAKLLAELEE